MRAGVDNQWADPAGLDEPAPTVAYRILDRASGRVVERRTESMWDSGAGRRYLSFASADQGFADAITALIQQACSYFGKEHRPLEGWAGSTLPDAEISARIDRMDGGENSREALRSKGEARCRYPLTDLPWRQQRALIENIERVKSEWCFAIVGEVQPPAAPAVPEYAGAEPEVFDD